MVQLIVCIVDIIPDALDVFVVVICGATEHVRVGIALPFRQLELADSGISTLRNVMGARIVQSGDTPLAATLGLVIPLIVHHFGRHMGGSPYGYCVGSSQLDRF